MDLLMEAMILTPFGDREIFAQLKRDEPIPFRQQPQEFLEALRKTLIPWVREWITPTKDFIGWDRSSSALGKSREQLCIYTPDIKGLLRDLPETLQGHHKVKTSDCVVYAMREGTGDAGFPLFVLEAHPTPFIVGIDDENPEYRRFRDEIFSLSFYLKILWDTCPLDPIPPKLNQARKREDLELLDRTIHQRRFYWMASDYGVSHGTYRGALGEMEVGSRRHDAATTIHHFIKLRNQIAIMQRKRLEKAQATEENNPLSKEK